MSFAHANWTTLDLLPINWTNVNSITSEPTHQWARYRVFACITQVRMTFKKAIDYYCVMNSKNGQIVNTIHIAQITAQNIKQTKLE